LWEGFPREFEATLWARWIKGEEDVTQEEIEQARQFLVDTAGLGWDDRLNQWPEAKEALTGNILEYRQKLTQSIREEVYHRELASPHYRVAGTRRLLIALKQLGLTLGIATAGNVDTRTQYAKELEIWEYFSVIYGGGKKGENIIAWMQENGVEPKEVALMGDGVPDIQAAHEAKILAIGFAPTPEYRERLIAAGADIIINGDFTDLEAILQAISIYKRSHDELKRAALKGIVIVTLVLLVIVIIKWVRKLINSNYSSFLPVLNKRNGRPDTEGIPLEYFVMEKEEDEEREEIEDDSPGVSLEKEGENDDISEIINGINFEETNETERIDSELTLLQAFPSRA
jgi:phosphoglycolate phosphatase-like HAD superfamily hydrolase